MNMNKITLYLVNGETLIYESTQGSILDPIHVPCTTGWKSVPKSSVLYALFEPIAEIVKK